MNLKKEKLYRLIIYMAGLVLLALGITLNTKAGLGVSPITSIGYCMSEITHQTFGDTTMELYFLFVLGELILHWIRDRRYEKNSSEVLEHANKVNRKMVILMDLLQIPLSIVFTRFLNLFGNLIPNFYSDGKSTPGEWLVRFVVLILALIFTGIGVAMSLNMRLIPNPGDGIVQAISDCTQKSIGLTKNCVDLCNVLITITVSMLYVGHLIGIGVGTILAVIGVGRIIAVFNHFAKDKLTQLAGVEE